MKIEIAQPQTRHRDPRPSFTTTRPGWLTTPGRHLETRKLDLENPRGSQRPSERRGAPAATSHGADVAIGTAGHDDKLQADASQPKYASTSSVDAVRKELRRTPLAAVTNSLLDSGRNGQDAAHSSSDARRLGCSTIDAISSQPAGSQSTESSDRLWATFSQSTASSERLWATFLPIPSYPVELKRQRSKSMEQDNEMAKRCRVVSPAHQACLGQPNLELTAAQAAVIAAAGSANVFVRGETGAGKTTVAERVAVACGKPDAPALLITRRWLLVEATKKRLWPVTNIAVHTMWSLKRHLLLSHRAADKKLPLYSIIILDGFGNSTPQLRARFQTLYEALGDHCPPLFILSDGRGSMSTCSTDNSDTFSSRIPWKTMDLGPSFIVSRAHAKFLNEVYLHANEPSRRLVGSNSQEGSQPQFVHADPDNTKSMCAYVLLHLDEFGADGMAILTPSVKFSDTSPVRRLLNRLTKLGVPIAEPRTHTSLRLADLVGKVVVATYSQFQGCHRRLVLVFGADASYFECFEKHLPTNRCPDRMLDALTCASDQLVLVHFIGRPLLPFVQWADFKNYASYIRVPSNAPERPLEPPYRPPAIPHNIAVSEIARSFDNDDLLEDFVARYLTVVELNHPRPMKEYLDPPDRVSGAQDRSEDVSDLNGIIVMEAFKSRRLNKPITVEQVTRRAINDKAERLGLTQRQQALKENPCTWLADDLEPMVDRLGAQFQPGDEIRVEEPLKKHPLQVGAFLVNLNGVVDVLATTSTEATVWEIKLVSRLSVEDVIQAAVYGFVYAMQVGMKDLPRVILFNIRDGEKLEIKGQVDDVRKLIVELLTRKYLEGR